jgi:hypothetical protein
MSVFGGFGHVSIFLEKFFGFFLFPTYLW